MNEAETQRRPRLHRTEKSWFEDNGWDHVCALCAAYRHSCSHGVYCTRSYETDSPGHLLRCLYGNHSACPKRNCRAYHTDFVEAPTAAFKLTTDGDETLARKLTDEWLAFHHW